MTATATVRRRTGRKRPCVRRSSRARKRRSRRRKALAFIVIGAGAGAHRRQPVGMYFSTVLVTKRVKVVGTHEPSAGAGEPCRPGPTRGSAGSSGSGRDCRADDQLCRPSRPRASPAKWPNTITVAVVERRPVIAVRQPEGYVLVDKSGVAYQTQHVLPPEVLLAVVNPGDVPLLERDGHRCRCAAEEAAQNGRSDDGRAIATASRWFWNPVGR